MKRWLAAIIAMVPVSAFAADAGCKGNLALTGACYVVTGEVLLSADIGPVLALDPGMTPPGIILRPGESLIVRAAPNSDQDAPKNLVDAMSSPNAGVHGRYTVCPIPTLPSQFPPEETHYVCIEFGVRPDANRPRSQQEAKAAQTPSG